jgi:nucleotide-binding universal stress UspA family protein
MVPELIGMLGRQGIAAEHRSKTDTDAATGLLEVCEACHANLLVTGAYGRRRWRERLFGGVTETLIREASIARLLSA